MWLFYRPLVLQISEGIYFRSTAKQCPNICFIIAGIHKDMNNSKDHNIQSEPDRSALVSLLLSSGEQKTGIFKHAADIKTQHSGNKVFFRGLIELSNKCIKDCYYCGIRKSNLAVSRYDLTDEQVLGAARFAFENRYGSLVIQSGELKSAAFVARITRLVREIKKLSQNRLGITLSLGEQQPETYKEWFEAGAHRYLLRIETSNQELYRKLHPADHDFLTRLDCLNTLKKLGYQVGTGVMIGLPFQTVEHLADDLLFMKTFDVDMVGMGPYIEHPQTPLYAYKDQLRPIRERFDMTLKMIAILRILMKDINIAATTALQAIDPLGREKAVKVGANVIMPNITPGVYRNDYALYPDKPCVDEEPDQCLGCLDARLALADSEIGFDEWGDSKHFVNRQNKQAIWD